MANNAVGSGGWPLDDSMGNIDYGWMRHLACILVFAWVGYAFSLGKMDRRDAGSCLRLRERERERERSTKCFNLTQNIS